MRINYLNFLKLTILFTFLFSINSFSQKAIYKASINKEESILIDNDGKILSKSSFKIPVFEKSTSNQGFFTSNIYTNNTRYGLLLNSKLDTVFIDSKYRFLNDNIITIGNEPYFLFQQSTNNLIGLMNKRGEVIIQPSEINKNLTYVGNGYFARHNNNKFEIIDINGKVISIYNTENFYRNIKSISFSSNITPFNYSKVDPQIKGLSAEKPNFKYGYIDINGNVIIQPTFNYALPFYEEVAFVNTDGRQFCFIDKTGKIINKNKFIFDDNSPSKFSNNIANVAETPLIINEMPKWGYINKKGDWYIKPQYKIASPFSCGLAFVQTFDLKTIIIDSTGKEVISGYWGNYPGVQWDENIIYVPYLGNYYNHLGKEIWVSSDFPTLIINSLIQLKNTTNFNRVEQIKIVDFGNGDTNLSYLDNIFKCKNIKEVGLNMSFLNNNSFQVVKLYELTQLQNLNLSHSGLTELAFGISKLENLEYLDLSYSKIVKLPNDILKLKRIKYINLEGTNAINDIKVIESLKKQNININTGRNELPAKMD